jgi:hypothetical protein
MCSLAVQRRGSSRPRRLGSSRLRRNALSPNRNSSPATSIAVAETQEGRGQKAHALCRALSNSSKLRNAKAGRVLTNAKVGVVRNAKSGDFSAKFFGRITGRVALRATLMRRGGDSATY